MKRKAIPINTTRLVWHDSGYMLADPVCRTILTLDLYQNCFVGVGTEIEFP
jgi:hypothetical protein